MIKQPGFHEEHALPPKHLQDHVFGSWWYKKSDIERRLTAGVHRLLWDSVSRIKQQWFLCDVMRIK